MNPHSNPADVSMWPEIGTTLYYPPTSDSLHQSANPADPVDIVISLVRRLGPMPPYRSQGPVGIWVAVQLNDVVALIIRIGCWGFLIITIV